MISDLDEFEIYEKTIVDNDRTRQRLFHMFKVLLGNSNITEWRGKKERSATVLSISWDAIGGCGGSGGKWLKVTILVLINPARIPIGLLDFNAFEFGERV